MATSPSHRFENGVLVERAISTPVDVEAEENEDKTQRPYKEPDRSTMADRQKARTPAEKKAVSASTTENKAAKSTTVKKSS